MEEKLKQIQSLLSMFDARDAMWSKYNKQIAAVISPTVLTALVDLFDLPEENVEWVDMQILDNILLVICNVTYDPVHTQSAFLQRVDEHKRPSTPIQVQRYLRVGVPLAIVFSPKEEIGEFLARIPVETTGDDEDTVEAYDSSELAEDTTSVPPDKTTTTVLGFDASNLTEDQLRNLMLYHHTTENTKQ
jgi:hypothetical protein